jgi:hypothetical protein
MEIETLLRQGCPVAWYAVVSHALHWLSRFAVESTELISLPRSARLVPDDRVEIFRPVMPTPWFRIVRA